MMLIMMSMAHRTAKFCVSSDSMLAVSVEATDLLVVISLLLISYSHAASTHSLPEGMDDLLCLTFAFWDNDVADNVIYQKLLRDKLSSDLGYVYENVVAQMRNFRFDRFFQGR